LADRKSTVTTLLSSVPLDEATRADHGRASDATAVLSWHWRAAGTLIRQATAGLLAAKNIRNLSEPVDRLAS
jgi:hypothetical protein